MSDQGWKWRSWTGRGTPSSSRQGPWCLPPVRREHACQPASARGSQAWHKTTTNQNHLRVQSGHIDAQCHVCNHFLDQFTFALRVALRCNTAQSLRAASDDHGHIGAALIGMTPERTALSSFTSPFLWSTKYDGGAVAMVTQNDTVHDEHIVAHRQPPTTIISDMRPHGPTKPHRHPTDQERNIHTSTSTTTVLRRRSAQRTHAQRLGDLRSQLGLVLVFAVQILNPQHGYTPRINTQVAPPTEPHVYTPSGHENYHQGLHGVPHAGQVSRHTNVTSCARTCILPRTMMKG